MKQVPMASASYWIMEEKDRLVGDVLMMCGGGVNPIGGDGRDDAITSFDEHRPWAVWQYVISIISELFVGALDCCKEGGKGPACLQFYFMEVAHALY